MKYEKFLQNVKREQLLKHTGRKILIAVCALSSLIAGWSTQLQASAQQRKKAAAASTAARAINVRTEPEAMIWLDEVRRGTTDASGVLKLEKVSAGRHTLRVRASGFHETTTAILPTQRGDVRVTLTRTTDEAELAFQQAESLREKARDEETRRQAQKLYNRAIELRPSYAAAHLGLARTLLDLNDYNNALDEVEAARRTRPVYPEASAVEGRILRMAAYTDETIAAFKRAIREGRGFQPEAHTGLALLYQDKGMYDEAAAEFRAAIEQLSDSEPAVYQLLGAVYERQEKYKEAVEAYEKYLQLAPEGSLASAVRSVLDQLRRQAEGQELQPE